MLAELKIVDTHAHINTDSPFDNEENTATNAHFEHLLAKWCAANVECGFISSFASVKDPTSVCSENVLVRELCQKHDDLYQWVVIDPRIEESFRQAREILPMKKCVGIKLHSPYHKYTFAEHGHRIFSFASEFGARVLIHPEGKATHILPFANEFPDVTFIMAHLNGMEDDHIAAIDGAKHRNVYTDVATAGILRNNALEYAVSRIGSERILFGTDTYDAGCMRGRVEYARISESDKINILNGNARRLFADRL